MSDSKIEIENDFHGVFLTQLNYGAWKGALILVLKTIPVFEIATPNRLELNMEKMKMSCTVHEKHDHKHGENCGHKAIRHEDHTDYLHDNHLHHVHGDHVDEHKLSESTHASKCTPEHKCNGHDSGHKHGSSCGHEAVPHADHVDYLVEGHLHSPCGDHCDHHGAV